MKEFIANFQFRKGDFVVFLFIGIIILITTVFFYRQPSEAKFVRIYVDSEEVGVYTLKQPYETTISVPAKGGFRTGYNVLKIKDETVFIAESSCPNQDCVRMGTIRHAGDMLICMPYKIMIRLEGGEAVDAVSY